MTQMRSLMKTHTKILVALCGSSPTLLEWQLLRYCHNWRDKTAGDAMALLVIFLQAMFKAFNICTGHKGTVNQEGKGLHSKLGKFINWMFRDLNSHHRRYLCAGSDSRTWMNIRTLCNMIIVLSTVKQCWHGF